ncbi:phosphatidylserine decarboxylase [Elusimicrobiota bacterium]
MRIAVQGLPYIVSGAVVCFIGLLLLRKGMPWGWALAAPGILMTAFCLFFFRDPDRALPADDSKIYSPGDGKVLSVVKEREGGAETIRIFLSVFDVHIQRAPVSGMVKKIEYRPGTFALAMEKEAESNERNVVTIHEERRKADVEVEQIAGFVARRIRCWTEEGARLTAGQRYGLIQFGSQAAVHLPAGARPLVKPGDRVRGGITVIGEWTEPK